MMDKKCIKCNQTKPVAEFPIRKETKSPQSYCLQCYRDRNKDRLKIEEAFMFIFIGNDPVWMRAYFG